MSRMYVSDLWTFDDSHVDLDLIEQKLWSLKRFQGAPGALVIRRHSHLVLSLAAGDEAPREILEWCFYHDDHEAVLGDFNGLALNIIRTETDIADRLAEKIDIAICKANEITYPGADIRQMVHYYDKLAESLEWEYGLGLSRSGRHPDRPEWLTDEKAEHIFHVHAELKSPYA